MSRSKSTSKLIVQSPAGRNRTIWLPREVAWAAACGIAKDTQHVAILYGEYGTARFNSDGGGTVEWNAKSTKPGETTRFDQRTTVCI